MKVNWNLSPMFNGSILVIGLFFLILTLVTLQVMIMRKQPRGPESGKIDGRNKRGRHADVIMRRVAKILGEEKLVEQPIVILNRTGGSWMVAVNGCWARRGGYDILWGLRSPCSRPQSFRG